MDIGQTKIPAGVEERQPFVIETETMQDGSLNVIDVDGIFDGAEAEVVGVLAVGQTPVPSGPRKPVQAGVVDSAAKRLRLPASMPASSNRVRFFVMFILLIEVNRLIGFFISKAKF